MRFKKTVAAAAATCVMMASAASFIKSVTAFSSEIPAGPVDVSVELNGVTDEYAKKIPLEAILDNMMYAYDVYENDDHVIPENSESVAPENSDPDVLENSEPVAPESSEPDVLENSEPVAPESSEPNVLENSEPVAPESSDPGALENSEPIASESADDGKSSDSGSEAKVEIGVSENTDDLPKPIHIKGEKVEIDSDAEYIWIGEEKFPLSDKDAAVDLFVETPEDHYTVEKTVTVGSAEFDDPNNKIYSTKFKITKNCWSFDEFEFYTVGANDKKAYLRSAVNEIRLNACDFTINSPIEEGRNVYLKASPRMLNRDDVTTEVKYYGENAKDEHILTDGKMTIDVRALDKDENVVAELKGFTVTALREEFVLSARLDPDGGSSATFDGAFPLTSDSADQAEISVLFKTDSADTEHSVKLDKLSLKFAERELSESDITKAVLGRYESAFDAENDNAEDIKAELFGDGFKTATEGGAEFTLFIEPSSVPELVNKDSAAFVVHLFVNVESAQSEPVESDTSSEPTESNTTSEPIESDISSEPTESDISSELTESDNSSEPTESDTSSEPTESDTTSEPIESDTSSEPIESDTSSEPTESDTTSEPIESDMSSEPTESDISSEPTESDTSSELTESNTSSEPTESNTSSEPTESKPASKPIKRPASKPAVTAPIELTADCGGSAEIFFDNISGDSFEINVKGASKGFDAELVGAENVVLAGTELYDGGVKIVLSAVKDINDELAFGDISGRLVVKADNAEPLLIELSGHSGCARVVERDSFGIAMKYVPYWSEFSLDRDYPWLSAKFSVIGELPEGLELDSQSGRLSGSPTVAGTFDFEIAANIIRNGDENSDTAQTVRKVSLSISNNTEKNLKLITDPNYGFLKPLGEAIDGRAYYVSTEETFEKQFVLLNGECSEFSDLWLNGVKLKRGSDDYKRLHGSTQITLEPSAFDGIAKNEVNTLVFVYKPNSTENYKIAAQNFIIVDDKSIIAKNEDAVQEYLNMYTPSNKIADGDSEYAETLSAVKIYAQNGNLPGGTKTVVKPNNSTGSGGIAMDIAMVDKNGETVTADSGVTVQVPLPEDYKDSSSVQVYELEDGKYSKTGSTVKDGKVFFTADESKTFVVTKKALSAKREGSSVNPETGVVVSSAGFVVSGAALIMLAATGKRKKK